MKCLEIEIERLNAPRRIRNRTESSSVFVEPEPAVVSPGMHVVDGKMLLLAEDRKKPKEKEGIFKRLRKFTYRGVWLKIGQSTQTRPELSKSAKYRLKTTFKIIIEFNLLFPAPPV